MPVKIQAIPHSEILININDIEFRIRNWPVLLLAMPVRRFQNNIISAPRQSDHRTGVKLIKFVQHIKFVLKTYYMYVDRILPVFVSDEFPGSQMMLLVVYIW